VIPLRPSEAGLWEMGRQNRKLQELRDDLRPAWNDSAAGEINRRSLEPMREEAERMLGELQAQHELLVGVQEQNDAAARQALEANRANAAVWDALAAADTELREGHHQLQRSATTRAEVRLLWLGKIKQALHDANAAGKASGGATHHA
jgi:hypothetical protein